MYSFYESFKNNILPKNKPTYRYIHVLTTWYQTYLIMPCLVPYLQRALSWLPSEIQYVGTQYTRLRTRIYTVYTVYVRWLQAMVTVHSVCVAYVWDHKVQFDRCLRWTECETPLFVCGWMDLVKFLLCCSAPPCAGSKLCAGSCEFISVSRTFLSCSALTPCGPWPSSQYSSTCHRPSTPCASFCIYLTANLT